MNIYKFVFVFLFLFFCQKGYCQTFDISFIDNKNSSDISIEFNNTIELHGFKLETSENRELLKSPYYKSKKNQYDYFSFLDRQFKDRIIAEIKSNKKIYKKEYQNIDYKINKFNIINNSPKAKAFVSVIFNNLLEVQCTILNGKYGLWVQWPSEKQNNKWNKLFIIKDSNLEYNLEKEILQLYHQKKNKGIL